MEGITKMNKFYKYLGALSLIIAMVFVSSCEDDNALEVNEPSIKIVSNSLLFGPNGGIGTIEFESEYSVNAYSEQPWCEVSVAGNTVTVTVSEHQELENRYSSIILEAGETSVRVVAQQNGVIVSADVEDKYLLGNNEHSIAFDVTSNGTISVSSSASWIRCTVDENKVSVAILKNETGHIRSGSFTYACGKASRTVEIAQASIENLYGNYRLMGYDKDNKLNYILANISAGETDDEILVTCTGEQFSWYFRGTFNPQTHQLVFDNAQYVGALNISGYNFYVYMCVLSQVSGNFTWDNSYTSEATVEYDQQKQCSIIKMLPFSQSSSSGVTTYDSWIFAAFMKQDSATGKPSGSPSAYPAIFYTPYLQSY